MFSLGEFSSGGWMCLACFTANVCLFTVSVFRERANRRHYLVLGPGRRTVASSKSRWNTLIFEWMLWSCFK